jgi:FKBP-type peptidyl-prolyl cis-trans isomerase FkpA
VNRRFLIGLAATAVLAIAAGCSNSTTAPSTFAPYSQVDLRLGSGAEAGAGTVVSVNYTGFLYDPTQPDGKGLVFDTSLNGNPLSFTLGAGQVIEGFDRGVTGMKVGGARRVVIPPSLGYGASRNNSIPPYATLVFDIDLVDVTTPASSGG